MGGYQRRRDDPALPTYVFANRLADLAAPASHDLLQLLDAVGGSRMAMDEFASSSPGRCRWRIPSTWAHIGAMLGADTDRAG